MRNRFDQLGKRIGKEALGLSGPTVAHDEIAADAHERGVAEQTLLNLQHVLVQSPSRTPEEQEFIVTMHNTWEKAREKGWEAGRQAGHDEGRKVGHDEGRTEGRAEEAARAVLTALRVRGIEVPDTAREHILAQKEPETLERWLEKAIVASSLDEVLAEPSRGSS